MTDKLKLHLEKAKQYILDLKYDWDTEGALPADLPTLDKALSLVAELEDDSILPMISLDYEGSVDISFQDGQRPKQFIFSISVHPEGLYPESITFYGRNTITNHIVKGCTNDIDINKLLKEVTNGLSRQENQEG